MASSPSSFASLSSCRGPRTLDSWPGSGRSPTTSGSGWRARLAQPSLWDAYLDLLASRGLPVGDDKHVLATLVSIARDRPRHDDLWQLAEDLLTHDELAGLWRARHVQMVERQIGTKSGTGGSTGAPYLHRRVPMRYYPLLWELRDSL